MALALTIFAVFTVLATLGLFLILRHHYGLRPAVLWSVLLLLAFAALGGWIAWLVEGSGFR